MDDLESSRSFAQYCCELFRESRWLKVALRTHEVACAICCGFTILPPSLALRAMSGESLNALNQRPDVRQAEENLHFASAKFGVAVANRLPNFNLTTDAGTMALISYIYAPVA